MPGATIRTTQKAIKILDGQDEVGVGIPLRVRDFSELVVVVTAPANASLTFKFQGSIQELEPSFSDPQGATNLWDYVAAYDINDPSAIIPGDTGVTIDNLTEAANTRMYKINVGFLEWLNIEVTARTDGSLTAYGALSN